MRGIFSSILPLTGIRVVHCARGHDDALPTFRVGESQPHAGFLGIVSLYFQLGHGKISGRMFAFVAQSAERSLGKTEVSGSIPDKGSSVILRLSLVVLPGARVAFIELFTLLQRSYDLEII